MKIVYSALLFMTIGAVSEPEVDISHLLSDQSEDRRLAPHSLETGNYYVMISQNQTALPESPECDKCDCVIVTCAAWYLVRLFFAPGC